MTEELIVAKERAEESDRLKSAFLANMSHEIRTPLNSIMGFASLLPEEDMKETMVQYANIIYNNSEQLVSIIDGIVMYAKLQARQMVSNKATFELNSYLKNTFYPFSHVDFHAGATYHLDVSTKEELYIQIKNFFWLFIQQGANRISGIYLKVLLKKENYRK